jgi:hypothetical protein
MGSPNPFQFSLGSIFLATAAVGVTLGPLKGLFTHDSLAVFVLCVPLCGETIDILAKGKGGWASASASFLLALVVSIFLLLLRPPFD